MNEELPSHLEELLADRPKQAFVNDIYAGAARQLLAENQDERRKNEELNKHLLEFQAKAERDDLTKLLKRDAFKEIVEKIRTEGVGGSLMFLDVDRFKSINDVFGHLTGDLALQAVASYLRKNFRPSDVVCRRGGEEFLIFFPNAKPEEILQKFKLEGSEEAKMNVTFDFHSEKRTNNLLTLSGGIAELSLEEDLDKAIKRADDQAYKVKNSGRNRLEIAPPAGN